MKINTLNSRLQALAFNCVSFGILTVVNHLWTWVAVLTEAISFWRIRTIVKPEQQQAGNDPNTNGFYRPAHDVSPAKICVEPPSPSPIPTQSKPSVCDVKDVNGVTKGSKFTFYYYSEKKESGRELTAVKLWRDDNIDSDEWWERLMSVRMGDMGWYCHQDLTVISGNVVRLWDEFRCRRRESFRCYSSVFNSLIN